MTPSPSTVEANTQPNFIKPGERLDWAIRKQSHWLPQQTRRRPVTGGNHRETSPWGYH
jgi:hypothetical protein